MNDATGTATSVLVADVVGLVNEAEGYAFVAEDVQVEYLQRRAALLHRLVDVLDDEGSRYLAQDAEDRATRAQGVAAAWAAEGDSGASSCPRPADAHPGCESFTRITPQDRDGPMGGAFGDMLPTSAYPNMIVGDCDLAARHDGPCEMFVDSTPEVDGTYRAHWITWATKPYADGPQTRYEWTSAPATCSLDSANGYACSRPPGHGGGHAFTVWFG